MDGGNDPDCRKAMDWERADAKAGAYEWYRRLIALRKSSKALTRGDFHVALCDDAHNAAATAGRLRTRSLLVIINAGTRDMTARAAVPYTGEWEDVLGGVHGCGRKLTWQKCKAHTTRVIWGYSKPIFPPVA